MMIISFPLYIVDLELVDTDTFSGLHNCVAQINKGVNCFHFYGLKVI